MKSSEKSIRRFRRYHIAVFVITILLLLAFASAICILVFGSTLLTALFTEEQSTNNSNSFDSVNFNIYNGVQFIFARIIEFLDSGVESGRVATAELLNNVNSTFLVRNGL